MPEATQQPVLRAAGSVGWRDRQGPGLALWLERVVMGEWILLTITRLGRAQLREP